MTSARPRVLKALVFKLFEKYIPFKAVGFKPTPPAPPTHRVGVAVGSRVLDLAEVAAAGLLSGAGIGRAVQAVGASRWVVLNQLKAPKVNRSTPLLNP